MKKLKIMIFIIIITFSFFLLMYNHKRSYNLSYNIGNNEVNEEYNKKDNLYLITITTTNHGYNFILEEEYSKNRKIVSNIKEIKTDNEVCLTFKFRDKNNVYPSCYQDKNLISYDLVSDEMKTKMNKNYKNNFKTEKVNKDYENIEINYLNNKKIFIWNYHGFYYLSNNKQKSINLFKRDIYKPNLIGYVENYMFLPDYDNMYEYSNFKVLNTDNLSMKDLEISESKSYF